MLSPEVIDSFNNDTKAIYKSIYDNERSYFIEKGTNDSAGLLKWLKSKGTSIDCYILYINYTNSNPLIKINNKLDTIRTIFYASLKPYQSQFFYWTLLLLIIHKFNFKKPIIKLVLYHYILRTIGDIIDGLGNLLNNYYSIGKDGQCVNEIKYTEQHPLKWALTRQFNSFFWYIGEIIGDWYPLLRTKAVARDKTSKICVYTSCGIYNLAKLSVPISQLFLNPTKLYSNDGVYNKDYVDNYYNYYSCLIVIIIATSLLYDATIYIVLKKQLFNRSSKDYGFLKKFRTISEYRIIISAIIGVIGLPFTLATAITKVVLYNYEYKDLNFSIEEFREVINNVQYMIIFIDQILLIRTKNDSSIESYYDSKHNNSSSNYDYNRAPSSSNYYDSQISSNNYYDSKLSSGNYYDSELNSDNYYSSKMILNSFNNTLRNDKGYIIDYKNYYSKTNDSMKYYYDYDNRNYNNKEDRNEM